MGRQGRRKRPGARRSAQRGGAFEAARRLHRDGHLETAVERYRRLVEEDPEDPDVLHYLGVCLHQCGQGESGVRHIRRALELAPAYADAHNNLGNVLLEQGRPQEALDAYRRVIALHPGHAEAYNNLGVALRGMGRYDESVAAYREAIARMPDYAVAWQNLGNVLARADRLEEAVAAYLRALELRPHDPAAYDALGKTLYRTGRVDEAVAVYRKWLQAEPAGAVARHMLAACLGEETPERASDDYVRQVFDGFAGSFDRVLEQLEYAAPRLLAAAVEPLLPDGARLDVLDAGCGTGLCAGFLAPRARRLVGVDLSPRMLAKAAGLRRYDELVHAELTAYLARRSAEFDLVTSADTLVYFGALDRVLAAAHGALRGGGLLAFTVEEAGEGDAPGGYALAPSGRYVHARGYVCAELERAGFTRLGAARDVLRQEGGQPVAGLVVVARRGAG